MAYVGIKNESFVINKEDEIVTIVPKGYNIVYDTKVSEGLYVIYKSKSG